MLVEPKCYTRKCIHFLGVIQPDGTEQTETNYCKAFPEGIPFKIAYGDNEHLKVISGQTGDFIYLRDSEELPEEEILHIDSKDSGSRFTDDHIKVYSPEGKLILEVS